jgi:D-aminoacyl-tRNA deacylase
MRLVIQRVKEASVRVEGETVSSIGPGLLVLVGIGEEDGGEGDIDHSVLWSWATSKILGVKLFTDAAGKMWRGSVMDMWVRK